MQKILLSLLLCITLASVGAAQSPKREFRGAWVATYANIDWPNRSQTPQQQRAALLSILDHHKATGINAVFIQVRSQCDALYQSTIEPWSADLTALQGRAPSPLWDPMQFAIEECHKRGMEFHAWLNPYRAIANVTQLSSFATNHVARQHPEWLIATGNLRTLDPGLPEVRNHIMLVIADIVKRYEVDGIHFDDYFYPNAPFNDDATFNTHARGFIDRADWRRDNVNLLIKRVNDTINHVKPWVKFGVSPSGIYRNSLDPAIGTNTSGLQHYTSLYADSKKWLQEGWVDYLAPQVYWYAGQPGANYNVIIPWWSNNAAGRHIYIGLAGYKVNDQTQNSNWWNPSQIPNQVRYNRKYSTIYGQAIYNTSSLRSNSRLGFRDSLQLDLYKHPALLPTMPWKDNTPPAVPKALGVSKESATATIVTWPRPDQVANEFDKVRQYVIYRAETPAINITDINHLLAVTSTADTFYIDNSVNPSKTYYYAITAVDRFHNESAPFRNTDYLPPVFTCVTNQELALAATCSTALPDYRGLVTASDDVSAPEEIIVTQSPVAGTVVSGTGIMAITLTATDASGKSATCTFTVTKKDVTPPTFVLAATQVVNPASNCEIVIPDLISELSGRDNCGAVAFTQSPAAGSVFSSSHGQKHIITVIAVDEQGNTTEKTTTLTVLDITAPTVIAKNITRTLSNGTITVSAAEINAGSYDNCTLDEASFQLSQRTFTCDHIGDNVVTLTARDASGNEASTTATVTIVGAVSTPAINLSRLDNTYTGLPVNTIALGYGAQKLTLTASNGAATTGITYVWQYAPGLSTTQGGVTEFTPVAAGTYTFTVRATNAAGCSETATVTIQVIDVRCDSKGKKVLVCHKTGSRSNPSNEICLSADAVEAHLKKGGTLGNCGSGVQIAAAESTPSETETSVIKAYPNPFAHQVTISFRLGYAEQQAVLVIYDLYGNKLKEVYAGNIEAGKPYTFELHTASFTGKMFTARLITSEKVYTYKLVKE